ncbi:MAG: diguanylate cyclase [Rubrivivax sp.]|nr:diguanylate cyclase [Rubrivivax sp.]
MANPAQIAKGALRRLAQSQREPTPENFARAYAEEAGEAASALPARARPLIERLAARMFDDAAARSGAVDALMLGDWPAAARAMDDAVDTGAARTQQWPALIERLARGLERGAKQWTAARKKESLQRLLDGSRSDPVRLQQRLGSLLAAWESDAPEAGADPASSTLEAQDAAAGPVGAFSGPGADGTALPDAWPEVTGPLLHGLVSALPAEQPRAVAIADELGRLASRLAAEGAQPEVVQAVRQACVRAERLLGHRHELFDALSRLCNELSAGLAELSEDESWARGQCENLHARLAGGVNSRSVRAATTLLAETRERQASVRAERQAASRALKDLIQRMLGELGELGEHTGRFEETVGRHAEAIENADTLESLAGVVREMVDDSRAVQSLVRQTQQRLQTDHDRAGELESRVRELEGELRRLSDEVSTDALTQVANRRGLMQAFEVECARVERTAAGDPLAVGLIDIDNFKKLNDTLGHAAGDQALKLLSAAVRERLRPVDTVARFGGEEFVLLLPGTPVAEAQQTITRLQRDLSASLFMHDGRDVFVTFSAGVTAWRPGETLDVALERSDEALYEAKRTGKNRTCTG